MDHLPKITIRIIPHSLQNYDTAGDYEQLKTGWLVSVSEMSDWRHEALVMIHELVEMILTKHNGVKWEDIDNFDTTIGRELDDPGNCPKAPYHKEHIAATNIERLLAQLLGVNWAEYDKSFDDLEWRE